MPVERLNVKPRLGHLNGIGFGIQRFPRFVQTESHIHTHNVVELAYIVAGRGTHYLGTHAFPTDPGCLSIMHYTQAHGFQTSPEGIDVINLYLDLERFELPDLGEELARPLYQILPMHPSLRHRRDQFVHLRFPPGGPQEALLFAMLAEQEAAAPGYREALRSQLRLLLIACARLAQAEGAYQLLDEAGETEQKVDELRRLFDAGPEQAVSLDSLARRLGWTKSHLCRAFRRHTGASITHYLQRQRIAAAMARLRNSRDSVLDVAIACGFNDQSYFNRTFRAVVGATPREYRQRVGGGR